MLDHHCSPNTINLNVRKQAAHEGVISNAVLILNKKSHVSFKDNNANSDPNMKGSRECYLLGQNATCKFWGNPRYQLRNNS